MSPSVNFLRFGEVSTPLFLANHAEKATPKLEPLAIPAEGVRPASSINSA
ncbi:hypothetical protein MY4038_000375 [Beauveria bassiana]